MAVNKPDFSLGRIDIPDVGGGLLDFADRQQKQYQIGLSNAVEADKLARDAKRFAREQELNARQDTEYNREIGLRTARQNLSKEFLANPYAAKFGSGKETALLDKQVNDYVNSGGVINEDMAKRLQSRYEEARPFREDATNALTSQMVLAGEDPTKAAQTGAALGSNLLSRVEQQAAVSANRKIEQDQYDEAAKRNKEALQLKFDIAKANQAGDKDKAELLFKQYQNMGGGTGGGSSGAGGLMETLGKIGPVDASSALAEGGPIDLARKAGYTESQIARAAGQSLDTDPTAWTWADNKLDTTMFTRNLGMQQPGSGLSKSINIRDIQAPTAEEWNSIVPNRAGYRVVDYDPKRFLEGSKGVLPELFSKDADKPLLSEAANKDLPSSEIKKLVVDKYGDSNFNKSTYDKNLSEVESGGNYNAYNATSKAFGKYQFVPSTINSLIKQDGGKHTIDEVRKSPELQDYYYDKLTKENINTLKSTGVPVNNFTVYMAHNLGPSQTENFFSNEPLTDATKKAIQAQGVEPTREAYTNRFMHKFENTATPEEKRPTVQKEDITRMTDAERKAYADKLFPEYATDGSVKELFSKVNTDGVKNASKNPSSVELRGQMEELNKQGINTKEDEIAFDNLQKQYKAAKTEENIIGKPFYKMSAPELINSLLGVKTEDKPNIVKQVSDKVKLANNPNAADEEAGLEDRTLDFLPLGAFAKTKGLKATDYDNVVMDLLKGNGKSGGLRTDDKLLNELYGNSPLATVKNISEFNKTATKMTPVARQELINYANQLRSVKNPTAEQEEMLSRIAETLRKTK
ncbi:MAG: hypothetical protein ACMV1B_09210 [Prevotella sp.]